MGIWTAATAWWAVTAALVVAELATGTFYLLMLAIGAGAAALGAHAGIGFVGQMLLAALIGGGAVVGWTIRRRRRPAGPPPAANPDLNLDIGARVRVTRWEPDGTARVQHRGAAWQARHVGNGMPIEGDYVIRAIEGQTLLLDR